MKAAFDKVLVANRGEIALRILKSVKALGLKSVLVASAQDRWALPSRRADEVYELGEGPVAQTYLDQEKILRALRETGAGALHPGYGFLSENGEFARKVEAQGVVFLGPTPRNMEEFGLKHRARELAKKAGVSLLEGSGILSGWEEARAAASDIGYPVMLKSSSGGGGIGMAVVSGPAELESAWERTKSLSEKNFGKSSLYMEKFLDQARHVEVQIFGDGQGGVTILGDRDCSLQRRNQKVVEECPAPFIRQTVRERLHEEARNLASSVLYRSAGTVEFLYHPREEKFYFLEMNTRLQVEHTVTEEVFGVDLVAAMIRLGLGQEPFPQGVREAQGHALQFRLYAEDPAQEFAPTTGLVTLWKWPADCRVDTWVEAGTEISSFYDPLLAKIVVHGTSREDALEKASRCLASAEVFGPKTNLGMLTSLSSWAPLRQGEIHTKVLDQWVPSEREIEILQGGMQTTVQDLPGRLGYWDVGVPPSGPMDSKSFKTANLLAGNPEGTPALEITYKGPKILFRCPCRVALTGAVLSGDLDGQPLVYGRPFRLEAGQILTLGKLVGSGQRSYLAVEGGFRVPEYLGSASTFTLGQFGGFQGRALRPGDVLPLGDPSPLSAVSASPDPPAPPADPWSRTWELRVIYGPHGAPDFFQEEDLDAFFRHSWVVHFNSSRTGVRLEGPRPLWARRDGGEAGLHPSNIHDNAYAIGSVDFTGDMPVILGPDGPSLGGFVCPAVVVGPDLWKLGQLSPGDSVRFLPVVPLPHSNNFSPVSWREVSPVVWSADPLASFPAWKVRRQGDRNLLIELGPQVLDLKLRFLVQGLLEAVKRTGTPGLIDLTPGIRSLQIHFDPELVEEPQILNLIKAQMLWLSQNQHFTVKSRVVSLPLSWDDPATQLAVERYLQGVRPNAPWGPSNIEFIRRINGLKTEQEVFDVLFGAHYLVMGLGDVYLGAPVATPVDPAHRLVTTKYNPARTWTPENAVGIGGAYLCVYGMEGPGGYQFVGRTLQMWNRYHVTDSFTDGKPWLLRFFDQIRFFPVSVAELQDIRRRFPVGEYALKIEETELDYEDFAREQEVLSQKAAGFQKSRSQAFEEERLRWVEQGLDSFTPQESEGPPSESLSHPGEVLESPMGGSVWKILVKEGDAYEKDQVLVVLESMKMEVEIGAEGPGRVERMLVEKGQVLRPGQGILAFSRAEG